MATGLLENVERADLQPLEVGARHRDVDRLCQNSVNMDGYYRARRVHRLEARQLGGHQLAHQRRPADADLPSLLG